MQISIVGCGWLGQPLAQQLYQCGHSIVATTRSEEKRFVFQQQGFQGLIYHLGDACQSDSFSLIVQSSLLIVNLPPGGRQIQAAFYIKNICQLITQARLQGVSKLIFISTTAVYGELEGELNERSCIAPVTESAKAHKIIEQHVVAEFAQQACILRLAGLVGQDRHPAKYLAGRHDIALGSQHVNLVHQQDVIQAIESIIRNEAYGHIYHLCAHDHPSRRDYYHWACAKLALPLPEFIEELHPSTGKQINASWTCQTLGIVLNYPSPYDMLN